MIMDDDERKSSKKKPKSNMKATKDFKLLSFGEEAEDEEETLETGIDIFQKNQIYSKTQYF